MSELARVRQGDGFCFVSCTGGGEAVVTIVLDASELTVEAACEEVRRSVQHLAGDAVNKRAIEDDEQCVYTGDLYDDAGVGGVVARRVDLSELRGTRWMEEEPIPKRGAPRLDRDQQRDRVIHTITRHIAERQSTALDLAPRRSS